MILAKCIFGGNQKDLLHSIGDSDGEDVIVVVNDNKFIPTHANIAMTFPEEYFTLFVECGRCGTVHNIKERCPYCHKLTDVYVD